MLKRMANPPTRLELGDITSATAQTSISCQGRYTGRHGIVAYRVSGWIYSLHHQARVSSKTSLQPRTYVHDHRPPRHHHGPRPIPRTRTRTPTRGTSSPLLAPPHFTSLAPSDHVPNCFHCCHLWHDDCERPAAVPPRAVPHSVP